MSFEVSVWFVSEVELVSDWVEFSPVEDVVLSVEVEFSEVDELVVQLLSLESLQEVEVSLLESVALEVSVWFVEVVSFVVPVWFVSEVGLSEVSFVEVYPSV